MTSMHTELSCLQRDTSSEGDLDRLFNGISDKYLEKKGFTPVISPELKAKRSMIIFSVDSLVYENDDNYMANESMNKNAFTNNKITDVMKFSKAKNNKVTFGRTNIARKATEIELKMYSISISPHEIQQDTFIAL